MVTDNLSHKVGVCYGKGEAGEMKKATRGGSGGHGRSLTNQLLQTVVAFHWFQLLVTTTTLLQDQNEYEHRHSRVFAAACPLFSRRWKPLRRRVCLG